MIKLENDDYIGKLIGNTGRPNDLRVAMRDSFSARRGEFVRIAHQERQDDTQTDVLGRIVALSRSNIMYNEALGEGISEVEILPSTKISGETVYGKIELVGYKDPSTNEIRIPRRPLNPGAKVYGVDYAFLTRFYEFSENTSIHLGNLVGYETGANVVPVYLDVNTLATEHLAVLAMTGSGKSYTVGRIIERMVAQMNGSVVVFDPHGEYAKRLETGRLILIPAWKTSRTSPTVIPCAESATGWKNSKTMAPACCCTPLKALPLTINTLIKTNGWLFNWPTWIWMNSWVFFPV